MKFQIIENGKKIDCDIIVTFKDDSNDKNYIVYTDGTKDSNDELEVYASRFIKHGDSYILEAIESEFEWNLIDNILESKFKGNG